MQIRGEEGEMTLVLFNVDDDDEDETRKKGKKNKDSIEEGRRRK